MEKVDIDLKQAMATGANQLEFYVGSVAFQLVKIPAGRFQMGSLADEEGHQPNEEPVRLIEISKAFYMGQYEVTQIQFKTVMGANPSKVKGDLLPVDQVTYAQALEFCNKLSQLIGINVTLPTEAQWEYACRAGTSTRFYAGNTIDDLAKVAWFDQNAEEKVHPVGQKEPNAWDLYDMHGNVWEFCLDFLPPYEQLTASDPVGRKSLERGAMRGGGWMHGPEYHRAATRLISDDMFGGTGIRIVINPYVQARP
jgi:formylglycine-generating enzyme required for sulfatase activity